MATLFQGPTLKAFDSSGAQLTGSLGVLVVRVVGPATYATGGIQVDGTSKFSSVLCALGYRQFQTASPGTVIGFAAMSLVENAAAGDTFANAKGRIILGRTISTPLGTVAAPVFTGSALGGAHSCGAVGCDSTHPAATTVPAGTCNAPVFTGTSAASIPTELANGATTPNGMTYEVVLLGVLK